ncbi:MAG: carboxylating nicotinate-nucleotide diphosphorylase [Pseudomonadales bacterium]
MTDPNLLAAIDANVRAALTEDVGAGDVSASLIDPLTTAHARVITREAGVWCGRPWVDATLLAVEPAARIHWHVKDGDRLEPGMACFEIDGLARGLLTAERTMLNFAQLLSGTATATRRYADLIAHTSTRLLDTRKTIPGLRLAQKYAVRCGGGVNHRIGLYDAFLLKENHIAAAGSIAAAVGRARALAPDLKLEVEVENFAQLDEAIDAGVDIVMLDNFDVEATREAVGRTNRRVALESSGGLDERTIVAFAETGVDYISVGNITKQVMPLDLSMRFTG